MEMVGIVKNLFELSKRALVVMLCVLFLSFPMRVLGQEENAQTEDFDGIEALIQILEDKGVMSEEEARAFVQRYKKTTIPRKESKNVIMIIPEEQETRVVEKVTDDFAEKIKQEVETLEKRYDTKTEDLFRRTMENRRDLERLETEVGDDLKNKIYKASWAQRIRFGGDIRLRYQGDFFDENNADLLDPADTTELLNTKTDRNRVRYRVRLAMKADVIDPRETNVGKVEVGVRLSTGNESDPVSTNDTMGDYQNKDSIVFDQAYLKWSFSPEDTVWGGKIPQVSLIGGRMPNPWWSSDLLWDDDLNFEGMAFKLKTDTLLGNPWVGFLTAGAFSIQEVELSSDDKWLYAGQIGVEHTKPMGLSGKLGLAYYRYEKMTGERNTVSIPNEQDYTAPLSQQKGNSLMDIDPTGGELYALASDFELLNIMGRLDYSYWFPIHCMLTADFVKNLGFDREETAARIGPGAEIPEDLDTGYQVKLDIGYPETRAFGEWNFSLAYKYIEGDAVLDAFTDSDFHLGGTNAKGWILGGQYGLYKDLWLRARWLTTDEVEGPPLAIDTLQVDVNAKF
jgi:hypothetical protein